LAGSRLALGFVGRFATAYFVVAEALINVARHSQASHRWIVQVGGHGFDGGGPAAG
jgi:hypothetical protein